MSKEPMNTAALPEVSRRRRRIDSQVSKGNISYQELLGIHLRQCRIRNLATITIDGYRNASRYFLDFAGNDLMCGDITQDLINEYSLHLQSAYKPQTVNSYMFKVCPTIRFGIEQGYIPHDIQFTHVVEQESIKEIYSEEELNILLQRPKNPDFCDFRAWVIINTFLATGIRASELRALRVRDVNLNAGYITLNQTKNREARFIPIPTTLHMILEEWLHVRNAAGDDFLFCTIFGEQLQRTVLQSLVKRYSLKRGVKKYGLHLYRHTFITLSIRKGMSPIMLKRITGHKSTKMLEHYYAFNPTDLVNIVDDFNPLEDFKPKQKLYK